MASGNIVARLTTWWLSLFLSECVRIGTTLSDELSPEDGVSTCVVLTVTRFGLMINELSTCIARDIFRAPFVGDLFSWALPGHHREIFTAGKKMPNRNGQQGMILGLQPTNANSYISLHPDPGLRDPPLWGLEANFCPWRSQWSSLGCGGTPSSHLKSTLMC